MYKQLSQLSEDGMYGDIIPAWLMQFADKGTRSEYLDMNPGMDAVTAEKYGQCASDLIRLFTGLSDLNPVDVEVSKNKAGSGITVSIDGMYTLMIVNSIGFGTREEDLTRYRLARIKPGDPNGYGYFFAFYSSESFSLDQRNDAEYMYYRVFTRADVLAVMKRYTGYMKSDDEFSACHEYLLEKDENENLFRALAPDEWRQDQLHGFYSMLDGVFHEKYGSTWGLFRLGSGKRMYVFRWHFRTLNGHGDEVFLQFEETRLKIMLTVSSYYRRKDAKNSLLAKMERKGLTGVIAGKKSRSHGRLETMTVYEIDRSQWYRRRDNGIMDTEETMTALERLDSLLDALRQ